ncbi:hypothetical protein GMMP15_1030091 [Candidatus Magnetomoraceae bacterium gMMP-15]
MQDFNFKHLVLICFCFLIYSCAPLPEYAPIEQPKVQTKQTIQKQQAQQVAKVEIKKQQLQTIKPKTIQPEIALTSPKPEPQLQTSHDSRGIEVVMRGTNSNIAQQVDLYDKMIAVIIGIDVYRNLQPEDHLKYAVRDARGVAEILQENYSFDQVISLYDQNATRDKIMQVLQGELSKTNPNDAVLIYFAGHGITRHTAQGDLGYLIPYDGSLKSHEMHKNISMQQINSDVCPLIPAKHALIIADACFGGLLLSTRAASLEPSKSIAYLREITKEPVRQIITAGGKNETVLDGGKYGHSVFTGRLIEALAGVKDFITAKQLGIAIQQKVYGDAAARGHKQKPLEGKIYGTGDFVFVPDTSKKQRQAAQEIKKLEAEIEKLKQLKQSAAMMQNKARQREIEREQLLKEASLKQAKIREQVEKRKEMLKAQAEKEERQNSEMMAQKEQERKQRLAYLKLQAEKLRNDLGSPAKALGLKDALKEVKEINAALAKLDRDFENELQRQLQPIQDYYENKMTKARSIPPRDTMFETEFDYIQRVQKSGDLVASLKSEINAKTDAVRMQVNLELRNQKQPLLAQRENLLKNEFSVDRNSINFKFVKYYPESNVMEVWFYTKTNFFTSRFPIPKKQAKQYWNNPDLLIPEIKLGITSKVQVIPVSALFYGPENAKYSAQAILEGKTTARDVNFIAFDNGTVFDTKTNLMWEKSGSNYKMSWYKTNDYIKELNQKNFAGYSDWRIPTIKELETLITKKRIKGYHISPVFNIMSSFYWSSVSYAGHTDYAWGVYFYYGYDDNYGKSSSYYVRAVRSGQ